MLATATQDEEEQEQRVRDAFEIGPRAPLGHSSRFGPRSR